MTNRITHRLQIRQTNYSDSLKVIELLNSEGWLKYIGERNVKNEEDAKVYIDKILKSYEDYGHGMYTILKQEDDSFIGLCGLLKRDYLDHPDIGFAFLPEYHGKGYAIEAAKATIEIAKALEFEKLYAYNLSNNDRSNNLLSKLGFTFVKTINIPGSEEELDLYEVML